MDRATTLEAIQYADTPWDILVIGGGATGLGTAVDSASRGYRTLLLEQADFAKGTSSRSTKLVHGGVRYLKQGNVSLVIEALKERGRLCHNAAHVCHAQGFIIPIYHWWERPFYGFGLKVYDTMAGELGLQPSQWLSKRATLEHIPTLEPKHLKGGILYYDGQFDDARLAINLAQTIFDHLITHNNFKIRAKSVINATGVFTDSIRKMDDANAERMIIPSQGTHLVLPLKFLQGKTAIMIPKTSDGRVLFAVPWHNCAIVGTTDAEVPTTALEPQPLNEEIDFILNNAAKYLTTPPGREDILSVFAGLRPLIQSSTSNHTASISRDHTLLTSDSGLITITGGKWTTYRKMAEEAVDRAMAVGGLEPHPCHTHKLDIHGNRPEPSTQCPSLSVYGTDALTIQQWAVASPELQALIHPRLPYLSAEVVWAARYEMACSIEDVLARRTRALLLDAQASIEAAPGVAQLLAIELDKDTAWKDLQIQAYTELAQQYLP